MELILQEQQLEFLSRRLGETILLEQTADVIVPDSYPDAERVVDAYGTLLLHSAECSGGSIYVSGSVQAGAIFVTEEGETECLKTTVPFSVRKELPAEKGECHLRCKCTLRSVDARPLNSRKLLLRVGIACCITAYGTQVQRLCAPEEPSENLQLRRMELPIQMPLALCEKSFPLNEELELPSEQPQVSRLLKCVGRLQVREQKIVGSKAVFKGTMLVHCLYTDRNEKLHRYDWEVPFSQYAEFGEDREGAELQTQLSFASFEVEPESHVECNRLFLSANLLAQCMAVGERRLPLVDDAYCTDALLAPRWEQWEMYGKLDSQSFRETVTAHSDEEVSSVVDVWAYCDEMQRERDGDTLCLRLPLHCYVLYYDGEGRLQGRCLHPALELETELHEGAECSLRTLDLGELHCSGGDGLDLRLPVQVELDCWANHSLRTICGGEITELPAQQGRRPSVVLRRTDGEEEAWEIAKTCRVPLQDVLQANGLSTPVIPANTMLLIPV